MDTIYIGLITLFIYGVYDISGTKKKLTDRYTKANRPYLYKLLNCFFCTTFWISLDITLIAYAFNDQIDIFAPIYFSGFIYLIIKVRWK